MAAQLLESFDAPATPKVAERTYQEGYDDGYNDARAAAEQAQTNLSDEFVQKVTDLTFTYAEARAALLAGLQPLFAALAEKIVPITIAEGFDQHLIAILQDAAAQAMPQQITLTVHPDQQAMASLALAGLDGGAIIAVDPALPPNAVEVGVGQQTTQYDFDALAAEIRAVLNALPELAERMKHHG